VLAVLATAGADARDVAAGAWLGERVSAPFQALRHVLEDREEALLLLGRACRFDRRTTKARSRQAQEERGVAPRELLRGEHCRDHRGRLLLLASRRLLIGGSSRGAEALDTPRSRGPAHGGRHRDEVREELVIDLLLAIPLERQRSNDVRREAMDHLAELLLPAGP